MVKLRKIAAAKNFSTVKETPIDKTTRIARKMVDDEAEQRQTKMARLRNDRLASEADVPVEAPKATSRRAQKNSPIKAVK